ncbi:MAG: DAK2 domain-containing protein [Ilumatobacteraceae bacterium]
MRTLERLSPDALRSTLITFRDQMRAHAPGINRLNVYPVPDGDTGTNMARTLDAVVAEMENAPAELDPTCDAISHGSLMGARGNSGVILSQILRGLTTTLKGAKEATAPRVAEALRAASTAAYQSVLKPIEGTILTVVRESADAAHEAAERGETLAGVLRAARTAGRQALANTPEMLPVLKDAGVVDAGGAGFLLLLDSALHVVDGEPLPEPAEVDGPTAEQLEAAAHRHAADGGVDVSELRYEVMYFLDLADDRIDQFKHGWGAIGDSIVVVGGDGLWNCHVHTNDIGAAVEVALDLGGRPRQIRVTDLFEEVADEHRLREASMAPSGSGTVSSPSLPAVTCAVVAVASGSGLAALFDALGVQRVVTGGQTLNPSTAELLEAVAGCNASQVVVLPNNKNIIPVADQLAALTDTTVVVVPTMSMPEALAALIVYDADATAADNAAVMAAAASAVAVGEVTRAVRATTTPAGPVGDGDYMGIAGGATPDGAKGIVAVSPTVDGAATALLERIAGPAAEILTVVEGLDASADTTDAIRRWAAEHRPGLQVEVHAGAQPLYPYLFGVE